MYAFSSIQHRLILTHTLLISLTPLIPVPFLDDWVKSSFQRRMVRQIAAARGIELTPGQVETLIQEDFWDGLVGGCVGGCLDAVFYLFRELLSKIFFVFEIQRAFNLFSHTYYTGFLLDAALLDDYPLAGPGNSNEAARKLHTAIRRTRYGANRKLINRTLRQVWQENMRPQVLIKAAGQLARQSAARLPAFLVALPRAAWQGLRSAPGLVKRSMLSLPQRIKAHFYLRFQAILGKERLPESETIEKMAQAMQESLLKMDSTHFDALHDQLAAELREIDERS